MGRVDPGWILLGRGFRCGGMPAPLRSDLAALLQGFPPADPAAEALELRLEMEGSAARLSTPGGALWTLSPEEAPLSSQIEYRLVSEAIARAGDRWILHAGAVEGSRGTCLIVGESGAGKTSLTLWLWSGGLRLVTDDLCPIVHGALTPERFPRALHMDCEYSPRLLERIPPRPPSYPADYYPFPDTSGGDPPPVSDLLILERGPRPAETAGPGWEISPLSQAEAAHHLLRAVIKSPAFEYGQALMDMIRLSTHCRAHRLRAATPEGAGAAAQALLTAG
jgi:hypothetical protein